MVDSKGYVFEDFIPNKFRYVSFGDSIAVGHRIDKNWEKDYGWDAQYGVDGRTYTTLVAGCYTDQLRVDLENKYGVKRTSVISFARSGDKVGDLMDKLSDAPVVNALKKADFATVCIGANDVLHYALVNLEDYLLTGNIEEIEVLIKDSLNILDTDSAPTSYTSLFNKLSEVNPKTEYIFTTIYNPYKYLWIEDGTDGFFKPLLDMIPRLLIDVDAGVEKMLINNGLSGLLHNGDLAIYNVAEMRWVSLELDIELGQIIKEGLLSTPALRQFISRINSIGTFAEKYVEGTSDYDGLNRILRRKFYAYQATHPNFHLVDTKAVFDTFPDRPVEAEVHYNDLVNVEFTRGYDVFLMDWDSLWRLNYDNPVQYWTQLAEKYITFKNGLPSLSVGDYVSFDLDGFAAELIEDVIANVIEPNVDPHPEYYGHKVMKQVFSDKLNSL